MCLTCCPELIIFLNFVMMQVQFKIMSMLIAILHLLAVLLYTVCCLVLHKTNCLGKWTDHCWLFGYVDINIFSSHHRFEFTSFVFCNLTSQQNSLWIKWKLVLKKHLTVTETLSWLKWFFVDWSDSRHSVWWVNPNICQCLHYLYH